jgi:predicted transcriptional regulator
MGELIKQIAAAQGISDRTVRMHLQRIKKKLYTDDLVNAVVIAVKSGMLDQTWKEWRWGRVRAYRAAPSSAHDHCLDRRPASS